MGHCAQNIRANLIFLFTPLPNFSGRWVARVPSEGEWCGESCFISLVQHAGVWVCVWLHTWHSVTALVPNSAWQGGQWSCRTSAILLLARDLSSSLMSEGWGVSGAGFRDRLFFFWKMGALLQSLFEICYGSVSSRCAKSVFTILTYALVFLFLPLS